MPPLLELAGWGIDQIIRWSLLWVPLLYAAFRMIGFLWLDIEQEGK